MYMHSTFEEPDGGSSRWHFSQNLVYPRPGMETGPCTWNGTKVTGNHNTSWLAATFLLGENHGKQNVWNACDVCTWFTHENCKLTPFTTCNQRVSRCMGDGKGKGSHCIAHNTYYPVYLSPRFTFHVQFIHFSPPRSYRHTWVLHSNSTLEHLVGPIYTSNTQFLLLEVTSIIYHIVGKFHWYNGTAPEEI